MPKSSTMVLAVGAGYVLGRKHKLRMAALVAAAAAGSGAGGMASRALRGGSKLLLSPQLLDRLPPEAGKLADLVRSDLAQASKAAVQAAVSGRIDNLTEAIYDRADALRGGATATEDAAEEGPPEDDADSWETDEDEADARPRAQARRRPARAGDRSGERSGRRPGDRPDRRGRPVPDQRDQDGRRRPRTGSGPAHRSGR